MKAIRISDKAYEFLKERAEIDHRPLIATLDLFVNIFKEAENAELEGESISSTNITQELQDKIVVKKKKKGITER